MKLKLLFQEVCKRKFGWDDPIEDLGHHRRRVISDLQSSKKLTLDSLCHPYNINDPVETFILHGFSDASHLAYTRVVYLQSITRSGNIVVKLISSKSRIVPMKKSYTIPRLELLGNYILAKLITVVRNALVQEIDISRYLCWSDSNISIAWIKAVKLNFLGNTEYREFKPFLQNRVNLIREKVRPDLWNYCNTASNPADIITRFSSEKLQENMLYWVGPKFLYSYVLENNKSSDDERDFLKEDSLQNSFKIELKKSTCCLHSKCELFNCLNLNSKDISKENCFENEFKRSTCCLHSKCELLNCVNMNSRKKVQIQVTFTRSVV